MPGAYEEETLEDEIIAFEMDPEGYLAITANHGFITILRSKSLQPPISNEQDYLTYLWVEAAEGFFLLSQQIREGKPEGWLLIRRITPESREDFFHDYMRELCRSFEIDDEGCHL
jgi:hypothetical protein